MTIVLSSQGEKHQFHAQPGLTVKKNQCSIDVTINEEFFNAGDQRSNIDEESGFSRHVSLPVPIQAHIDHLRLQVNDLTLQLAEERLNHKQTRVQVLKSISMCLTISPDSHLIPGRTNPRETFRESE